MTHRFERALFFLTVFFLPFQVGKHFWPSFSYISGIRVDYISPTLHFFDITILLLVLVYFFRLIQNRKFKRPNLFFVIFLIYLALLSFFAASFELHLLGLLSILEAIFLGFYTAQNFKKKDIPDLVLILVVCSIAVSIVAIEEFLKQSSLGGIFYFLGERNFNFSTIGIATFNFNGGKLLRPYSTFPHPNVLSFFLLFSFVITSLNLTLKKINRKTLLVLSSLTLSSIVIFISFSRVSIFLYILFLVLLIYRSKITYKKFLFSLVFIFFALFIILFSSRFLGAGLFKNFSDREEIASITFEIIQKNPLLGTGFNNYFIYEGQLQKKITPTFLQPAHNIYLLLVVETGILGTAGVLVFVILTIENLLQKIKNKNVIEKSFYTGLFFLLCGTLFIGIFDHFILTLSQGLLLTALIVGFSWTKI